jgi:cytochrome c-type biogenesis protein CcmE
MANANRWWKVLGVASVVGVVATGALVARDERQRRAYTPDEIRDRLRERLEESARADADPPR